MAFVPAATASVFLGSAIRHVCSGPSSNTAPRRTSPSMVLSKSLPNWPMTNKEPELIKKITPYKKLELKKGDRFNFVRFAVDDFTASSYFDGLTGAGVRVAVLDHGADSTHPALKGRIDVAASKNYTVDNGGDPRNFSDVDGHGTHVTGIIAAEKRKAIMYGIAPGATIVVKKVFSNEGERYSDFRNIPMRIAKAIRDAIAEDCHVISMSLGVPESIWRPFGKEMTELYAACQEAMAAGVTIVAAAGNSSRSDVNTIEPPALYGGVITVAAHDDKGKRCARSSCGGELDFMAPGEVISTYLNGSYSALSGTSMACPLVAGLAALLIEAGKRTSPSSLPDALNLDMTRTGFRARNNFEVRELLRLLSDRPQEHSRIDGYGCLSRAYQYVNGEISENI